jgi:hypothetical protein
LAVACCRAAFAGSGREVGLAIADIDWDRFLALVRFHRIEGLIWSQLSAAKKLPSAIQHELHKAAMAIAARNLQAAAECGALLERFESRDIPLLFVKGITLGALAYDKPSLKSAVDIDILIDPRDLGPAAELLQKHGWTLDLPRATDLNRLGRWHRLWKESVWLKPAAGLQMDLHTRLTDNKALVGGIDVHSPREHIDVGGGTTLPTLAHDELFAYLAVHGASSAWFRLKWISDFAALADRATREEITRSYRRSWELGAGRAAGQALLLADALFGTLQKAPELKQELAADRSILALYRTALRLLSREPKEPTEEILGTLPIRLSQFRLIPGLAFKWTELTGQFGRVVTSRLG